MKIKFKKELTVEERFYYGLILTTNVNTETASIKTLSKLMANLEQEFRERPNGFCKHYGDDVQDQKETNEPSWREMLVMARGTFNKGFEKIGVTHSEESFRNAGVEGRFAGKFYCRVKTAYKYRTFYYRNDALLDAELVKYRNQLAGRNSHELELKA